MDKPQQLTWTCAGCDMETSSVPHLAPSGRLCSTDPAVRVVPPPVYTYVRKPAVPGRAPGRPRKVMEA